MVCEKSVRSAEPQTRQFVMSKNVATKRRKRTVIRSEDDIKWRVIYAEPSKEADEIYTDLMRYLYRFGVNNGVFLEKATSKKST